MTGLLDKIELTVDGCWTWTAALHLGYGVMRIRGTKRNVLAHRYAYELFVGPIPAGMQIDHLCRNRACVRPDHLEAVSRRTNILRGIGATAINARKTHCKNGHAFTADNTSVFDGHRTCRTCKRAADRRRRQAVAS